MGKRRIEEVRFAIYLNEMRLEGFRLELRGNPAS